MIKPLVYNVLKIDKSTLKSLTFDGLKIWRLGVIAKN